MRIPAIFSLLFLLLFPSTLPALSMDKPTHAAAPGNNRPLLMAAASSQSSGLAPAEEYPANTTGEAGPAASDTERLGSSLAQMDFSQAEPLSEIENSQEESNSPRDSIPTTAVLCVLGGGLAGIAIMRRK